MLKFWFIPLLTAWSACMAHAAEASEWKFDHGLRPSLLHGSAVGGVVPALKYRGSVRYDHGIGAQDDISILLESKGAVASDARANSENLYAALHLGYSHTSYDWERLGGIPEPSERRGMPLPSLETRGMPWMLDVFMKTRFESDQPFDNYNITLGPHLGFTPGGQKGWQYLVPSSYVDFQWVDPLRSKFNHQIGARDHSFWRFDVSSGWYYPIGAELAQDLTWIRPLDLQFDLHYFRAVDLQRSLRSSGQDDGIYYAGTIGYNLRSISPDKPSGFIRYVPYVFLSLGHGVLPPTTRSQTMLFIGIVYGKSH